MPAVVRRLPGRRHPRVPFSSDIAVQVPDWVALQARGLDVSYGGMSLILSERLSVGDKLLFGLRLRHGAMKFEAVVRNVVRVTSGRFRVGLEWHRLPDRERDELHGFVDRVAEQAA